MCATLFSRGGGVKPALAHIFYYGFIAGRTAGNTVLNAEKPLVARQEFVRMGRPGHFLLARNPWQAWRNRLLN